jgi:phospholipase/carboxylesterase
MHEKNIITAGKEISRDSKVLIMIHGRGGSAADILSLSTYLEVDQFSLLAPQATNHTWYPYSFLAPTKENEPWLSSALQLLADLVSDTQAQGVPTEHIYFLGFSQGACLTLEFVTRNAKRYGGVVAFTGGLIGDKINPTHYSGDFEGTPIFIGSGNPDPHVPVERVYATTNILKNRHAAVTEKIYAGMGHTINQDEMEQANRIVFGAGAMEDGISKKELGR